MVFYCVNIHHTIYPFYCPWPFGSFPFGTIRDVAAVSSLLCVFGDHSYAFSLSVLHKWKHWVIASENTQLQTVAWSSLQFLNNKLKVLLKAGMWMAAVMTAGITPKNMTLEQSLVSTGALLNLARPQWLVLTTYTLTHQECQTTTSQGSIPGFTQWVKDPVLVWAVV